METGSRCRGTSAQLARLRRQHSRGRFQSKAERNLAYACSEIRRIASAPGLGESVWEQASALFRTAQHEDLVLGRSIESMAAASVYATCRCTGLVQPIEGVAELAQVDKGRVQNAYGVLDVELGLAAPVQRPTDLVPWVADGCDAPNEVQRRALELAGIAEEAAIENGRKPSGVAAACIYRAAEECGWVVIQDVVVNRAAVDPPGWPGDRSSWGQQAGRRDATRTVRCAVGRWPVCLASHPPAAALPTAPCSLCCP